MKDFFIKQSIKFQRFMTGRYGIDSLYRALLVLYFVLILISSFLGRVSKIGYYTLWALATLVIVFAFYRVFSKNIQMRKKENADWLKMSHGARMSFNLTRDKIKFRKTHVFRRCPSCKAVLRLPKKKGKHTVTCPHCKATFDVKVR